MIRAATLILAALSVTGCATTTRTPTDVTRYHLNQPIAPGSFAVEPAAGAVVSPEYDLYAGAVAAEMARLGFTRSDAPGAQYVVAVGFNRALRGQVRTPPKFSIGLGGGSFGRGGGVGGGLSTGVGSKTRDVIGTQLSAQIRRRSDGAALWEGQAQNTGLSGGRAGVQPVAEASRLASALFKGFPGESGISITVK